MTTSVDDRRFMQRALELALQGLGHVEPNPMVGCVVVRDGQIVGEGWHQRFGGPHAEIEALAMAGERARGATVYVTLEPCCHQGKTGPCTTALIAAGIHRVAIAAQDPNPRVAGRGIEVLRTAGVTIDIGVMAAEATDLIAPFAKLVTTGWPWVIAKWAMSLDGRLAAAAGQRSWISGEASRERVHQLRGRVDAILVGRGTAEADNPLLTARPPGTRKATRIVLDSRAQLSLDSELIKTVAEAPLLVATTSDAPAKLREALFAAGAEVVVLAGDDRATRFAALLDELGRRQMTNLLVEGGGEVLGMLSDARLIDEAHVFVAPRRIEGDGARAPVSGSSAAELSQALGLRQVRVENVGEDIYVSGRVAR